MKQVELVRQRVATGLHNELQRVRIWISGVEGNEDCVERLRGEALAGLLAGMTEALLTHLGHQTALNGSNNAQAKARRVANKVAGL